jgi:hypothetical protein
MLEGEEGLRFKRVAKLVLEKSWEHRFGNHAAEMCDEE